MRLRQLSQEGRTITIITTVTSLGSGDVGDGRDGYRVENRRLLIAPDEADLVRRLFRMYAADLKYVRFGTSTETFGSINADQLERASWSSRRLPHDWGQQEDVMEALAG